MQVYTFYSRSHEPMLERFLRPSATGAGFTVRAVPIPQLCPTGAYYDEGWLETMRKKVELLQTVSKEHRGDVMIYSDCDIIFNPYNFNPERARNDLGKHFVAMQDDVVQYCCGFMIMRGSPEMDALLDRTMDRLEASGDDQTALNHVLKNSRVGVKRLPRKQYACIAQFFRTLDKNRLWNGTAFRIPRKLKVFHANWTRSVAQKEELLQFVQRQLTVAPGNGWGARR